MHILTLSLLLSAASAQLTNQNTTIAASCAPVHIIVCRASGESPGEGVIASLSTLLKQQIPGSTSEALVYPAKMPYSGSIPVGVANLKTAIKGYTDGCPSGKLVIIGYSQGAAVLTDALCGGGGSGVGPVTPGVSAQDGRLIKAVVGMGDPRFVPGTTYDAGTNKNKGGVSMRDKTVAQCPTWVGKMVSYCDVNDARCASGSSLQVHMTYTQRYNQVASKFVMGKLNL